MKKRHMRFYSLLMIPALTVICLIIFFYIRQLDITISDNIVNSISEIAAHDKTAIQTYIEIYWDDLYEITQRFMSDDCTSIQELEEKIHLESSSSGFIHLYLVAEDGTIYTDSYNICVSGNHATDNAPDFLSFFADGHEKVIARMEDNFLPEQSSEECLLYGIRLNDCQIAGIKMQALIGITSISSIHDHMVIHSFIKNGTIRGHSALIDLNGNYIIDVNQETYLNNKTNLYQHLLESADSELTNAEVDRRLRASETFGFYHTHAGAKHRELFYFIPFNDEIDLYFIMSIKEEVFMEQTRTFTFMSISMLVFSMLTVIIMLIVVMKYQYKTIKASARANAQKEFLSNMSHEIRTPLNGLIGINHLIMVHIDDESKKSQIKEWLLKSHSTASYLLSLVNDILDFSKLQAGKVEILNEPLLIDVLIDEVVAMQAEHIKSKGIEFIIEKNLSEPCIQGDATHIKQILMNILGNAAKFTPSGKYIRLSVSQQKTDPAHVLTIYQCEDTGIGISREYIDKIFDSFSQERSRNAEGIKGTGLGMTISKLLANAMDGDITVESELNVGSTFTVTIPSTIVKEIPDHLKKDLHKGTDAKSLPSSVRVPERPIKILVAEDVELNAEILLEILSFEGFEAVWAKNGKEAVELFCSSEIGEFDLILMDMQMPVMDGCAAAREIRALDRPDAFSVQIYACTANTFQEDQETAIKSGMNDFLTKPIDPDSLMKKIRKIFGQKP